MSRKLLLHGKVFGRLTAVSAVENCSGNLYVCVCECGGLVQVQARVLTGGKKRSCGCLHTEQLISRNVDSAKHSMSRSPIYAVWASMKARCSRENHKAYANYGGRGITVCAYWQTFDNFYSDMGDCPEGLSLERKDNSLGYFKDNCRWATAREQAENRRSTHMVTYLGETKPLTVWHRELKLSTALSTVRSRLVNLNWSPEEAFLKEVA